MSKRSRPKKNEASRRKAAEEPASDTSPTRAGAAQSKAWTSPGIVSLVLGLFTLAVFWPATFNGFVNFDDGDYILENANVLGGLSGSGIHWAFTTGHASNWHPLTWLSHMLDCQWYGLHAGGHHLTSVLIHTLSTVLLFLVLRRLTGTFWQALFVAVVFGVHPTRVESVAWASERKDVLCTFFWIATMGAYSRWISPSAGTPERRRWYALALGLFTLGLLSKPMIVTLPCVLLLLDFWPAKRFQQMSPRQLVLEKLPFFLLTIASSIITLIVQQNAMPSLVRNPMTSRVANAIVSYGRYLGQLFWPADLAVYYPRPAHWEWTWWLPCALVLLVISAMAWGQRSKRPYLLVGWLWYLGTAAPIIGLVQVGGQAMADRYTYIPTIGLLIMFAWGAADLAARFKLPPIRVGIGATAAVLACAALTLHQISFWKDGVVLFRHNIAVTPIAAVPYSNLAWALLDKERYAESIPFFEIATLLSPDDASDHCNYGLALLPLGRTDEAIAQFDRARALSTTIPIPDARLGLVLLKEGRLEEALRRFAQAVQTHSQDAQSRYHYADALKQKASYEEAIAQYREAIRLKPEVPGGYFGLAQTMELLNRKPEAIEVWEQALKLAPDHSKAHNNLGVLLAQAGQFEAAAAHFRKAVQLDPADADAANNLQLATAALARPRTP